MEVAKPRKREESKRPAATRPVRPTTPTAKTPSPSKPATDAKSDPKASGAIASTAGKGTSDSAAKGDLTQAGRGGSGGGTNDGGTGQGADPASIRRYHSTLAAWLARHKRYPELARQRQEQGTVRVTFSIDRQGRLLSHRIESSSGYPVLDQEAQAMLQRASPMPPIPANLGQSTLTITVPISFILR
ncbi:MAG: energy transducer TonB [Thermochromatium sp.]